MPVRSQIVFYEVDAAELASAIKSDDAAELESLLKRGIDVNGVFHGDDWRVTRYTALHVAASSAGPEVLHLLVRQGAALNAKDSNGNTPLIWAVSDGNIEAAGLLVSAGADVNIRGIAGDSALHDAVNQCDVDVCKMLVDAGASVHAFNDAGVTPLGKSVNAFAPDIEKVRLLIASGADTSAIPPEGPADTEYLTPFQSAIFCEEEDAARLMYEMGAENPYQTTFDGRPLDELVEGCERMRRLLMSIRTDYEIRAAMVGETTEAEPAVPRRRSEFSL